MTDIEIAWLAGFLEGEGSFGVSGKHTIGIWLQTTDGDVIEKAAKLMGSLVHGPYTRPSDIGKNRKPVFTTTLCSSKAADVMRLIRPHMGARRGAKIDEILSFFATLAPQAHSQVRVKIT